MAEAAVIQLDKFEQNPNKRKIPLKDLKLLKGFNPRRNAEPDEDLKNSVKNADIQEDLHIWKDPKGPGFFILEGERRYRAASAAFKKDHLIPCEIHPEILSPTQALMQAMVLGMKENLSDSEKADAYKRLMADPEADEKLVAKNLGLSPRTLKERMAINDRSVPEIKTAVDAPVKKDRIAPRPAARAAGLPEKTQKALAPKLKGKPTKEAMREVQKAEREMKRVRPGRRPSELSLRKDANRSVQTLYSMVSHRLAKAPGDLRAVAHMEVLLIMVAQSDPIDLYEGDGRAAKKMLTPAGVRELAERVKEETKARVAREKASPAKKKSAQKKKAAKKAPAKAARTKPPKAIARKAKKKR